jgi:hypothetical protein
MPVFANAVKGLCVWYDITTAWLPGLGKARLAPCNLSM